MNSIDLSDFRATGYVCAWRRTDEYGKTPNGDYGRIDESLVFCNVPPMATVREIDEFTAPSEPGMYALVCRSVSMYGIGMKWYRQLEPLGNGGMMDGYEATKHLKGDTRNPFNWRVGSGDQC